MNSDVVNDMMKSMLARVHVIRCPSSFHFLAALASIKRFPSALNLNSDEGIAAILVDNVSAYYYVDRAPKSGSSDPLSPLEYAANPLHLARVQAAMAAGLSALQQQFKVAIIATKHIMGSGGFF
jgi:hypothetical protein